MVTSVNTSASSLASRAGAACVVARTDHDTSATDAGSSVTSATVRPAADVLRVMSPVET